MRRTDFPFPATWDKEGLEAAGFRGFRRLVHLSLTDVTENHGVYVVLRPYADAPYTFLDRNPLGAYTLDELERRWIPSAPIVYIGKAGGARGLKQRIRPYSRKGESHSGGRSIWQLADADDLLICWKATPGLDPRNVEKDYLDEFKLVHAAVPFANIDGH